MKKSKSVKKIKKSEKNQEVIKKSNYYFFIVTADILYHLDLIRRTLNINNLTLL